MRLILLGCPGAGKGTQAKYITEKYHIPAISTGEILRAAIQQGTELGKKVQSIVDSGQLVPDVIMIQLIRERLSHPDAREGFLLDGFPRTVAQAEALQSVSPIDFVVDIDVPEEEVIKRLSGRRIHPASGRTYHVIFHPPKVKDKDDVTGESLIQRPDDSEETIRKRLHVYHEQTKPLRDYYQNFKSQTTSQAPIYIKIDGLDSVDNIKEQIFDMLDKNAATSKVKSS